MLQKILIIAVLVLVIGCAGSKTYQAVPLVWKPTSNMTLDGFNASGLSGITFTVKDFRDSRQDKKLIGRNAEDQLIKQVSTNDNVGLWCSDKLSKIFKEQGINVAGSGNVVLEGEVIDFMVNERDEYRSNIKIHLVAKNRDNLTLWEGDFLGSSNRFGRSFNLDNYYEVLSDSMINGVAELLKGTSFIRSVKAEPIEMETDRSLEVANKNKKHRR